MRVLTPDEMIRGTIADLVAYALEVDEENRAQFWVVLGVICGRLTSIRSIDTETLALWRSAWAEPRGDYDSAVKLLNDLIGRETCK